MKRWNERRNESGCGGAGIALAILVLMLAGGMCFGQATPTVSPTRSPTASPTRSPTASPTVSPTPSPTPGPVTISMTGREAGRPNKERILSGFTLDDHYTTLTLRMGGNVETSIAEARGFRSGAGHAIAAGVVAGAILGGAENELRDDVSFTSGSITVTGARSAAILGGELNVARGHSSAILGGSGNDTGAAYVVLWGQGQDVESAGALVGGWFALDDGPPSAFGIVEPDGTAFAVGNGGDPEHRSNALRLEWDGDLFLAGRLVPMGGVELTTAPLTLPGLDVDTVVFVNSDGELDADADRIGWDDAVLTVGIDTDTTETNTLVVHGNVFARSSADRPASILASGPQSDFFDSDEEEGGVAFFDQDVPVFGPHIQTRSDFVFLSDILSVPNIQTTGAIAAGTTIYNVGLAGDVGQIVVAGASGELVAGAVADEDGRLLLGPSRLNLGATSSETITGGVVDVEGDGTRVELAAETGTADDLDGVDEDDVQDGDVLILSADAGDTITVKDGTAGAGAKGFSIGGDRVLNAASDQLTVMYSADAGAFVVVGLGSI